MNTWATDNILNGMPAVICTAGSNIIATQDNMAPALSESLMGRELFDHMEPSDIIKYTAHFHADKRGVVFSFFVKGMLNFCRGVAVFKKILERRYAVVFLLEDTAKERECVRTLSERAEMHSGYDLLCGFTHMNEEPFWGGVNVDVIDAVTVAEFLCDHGYCPNLYIRTEAEAFSKKAVPDIPLNVPRSAFLQLVMLMIRSLNAVSVQRSVTLRICKFTDRLEMRFTTDSLGLKTDVFDTADLTDCCPEAGVYIALSEYICRLYNARLDAFTTDCSESLSLILTFYDDIPATLDFKSCDCLEGIENDISSVACQIDLITYKGEGRG